MPLELPILFQSKEALELECANAADRLPLAGPDSHHFCSDFILIALLGLDCQVLLQLLYF